MCLNCDYPTLLQTHDLDCTPHRLAVMEAIGGSPCPLRAGEILKEVRRTRTINRVTVYRILDLLVDNNLLERMSTGDRSFRYGLAPNENHPPHPHFYCTRCGNMVCLDPEGLDLDARNIAHAWPGSIEKIEIRLDGVCQDCLRR